MYCNFVNCLIKLRCEFTKVAKSSIEAVKINTKWGMFMANNQASKSIVIDYDAIAKQESFKALVKKKNAFLWSITVFFLAAYMLLPILTSYTTILHQKAFGEVTWVWIYAAGLFIMTWSLCHLYVAKANSYDKEAKAIIAEYENGGGRL